MESILDGLYRNSITLTEVFHSKIEGTGFKDKACRTAEKEFLESIGEEDKDMIRKLNEIEDEISNLIVGSTRRAFMKGLSYGMFLGMNVIKKERELEAINEKEEMKDTKNKPLVDGYNEFKRYTNMTTGEPVKSNTDVFKFRECDADHAINSVVNMFYDSKMSLAMIEENMDETYYNRYLNLSLMESYIISELSDYSTEKFLKFVNLKKEQNNFTLINCYFDGLRVGLKLARECDLIDRESATVNEKIIKKQNESTENA